MKKRMFVLAAILLMSSSLISCGTGGGSPSGVVKSYYVALNAGDLERAETYWIPGKAPFHYDPNDPYKQWFGKSRREYYQEFAGNIEKVQILDEEIWEMFGTKEASVTVEVTIAPALESRVVMGFPSMIWEGGIQYVSLGKRKSGWKIESID